MSLKEIVRALGGDLYDRDTRANVPGPGHRAGDRSVSLLLENGRVVVHCFGAGDWREVLDNLRERGLIDQLNRPTGRASQPAVRVGPDKPARLERITVARRLWELGKPLPRTLGERYIRNRAVIRTLPDGETARFAPEAPVSAYRDRGPRRPALMLAIRDPEGALCAVELTYLNPAGHRAIDLRLSRKTIGVVPPSSAVRLDAPAEQMLVAEGFLTTASATERFGLPGWALLSTRNMRRWRAPEGVRFCLIAADPGKDGEASAAILRAGLGEQEVASRIVLPDAGFSDWNHVAASEAGSRQRELI